MLRENVSTLMITSKAIGPKTNWRAAVIQGEKIGLGSQDYELIKI